MHAVTVLVLLWAAAASPRLEALETDQYWSWHRPLADSTGAVNAWINLAVTRVLDEADPRLSAPHCWPHFSLRSRPVP